MLHRLYDWTLRLAAHPHAMGWLFAIAFVESSIFPIPPDVLLIAMVMAAPSRAWRIAAVCTAGSAVGGLAGYAIGYAAFDLIGQRVVDFYGLQKQFAAFEGLFEAWGWWLVAGAGFTPFPYKVMTIASGVAHLDLVTFAVASALSRGARFFLVAWLLHRYGAPIGDFIRRRLGLLTTLFFVLLLGGFVALRYL